MLDSIYVGMTGLSGYAKGLTVISNNVANLNSPGFKGAQLQFSDLYYKDPEGGLGAGLPAQIGAGLQTGGTFLNFQQGESRDTANDLDVMVDGAGLFVLRQDSGTVYTRAGQFEINTEGLLVDRATGARVAAYDGSALSDISIAGLRFSNAKQTATVTLAGNLSISDTQHVIQDVTVYDTQGTARKIKLTFDSNIGTQLGAWTVTAALPDDTVLGTGSLRFENGKPMAGADSVAISYSGTATAPLAFTLKLGSDATYTEGGADSTLVVQAQDGFAAGSLIKTAFDADGYFTTSYSNGETTKHGRLALAWFNSPDELEQLGSNTYAYRNGARPQMGHPNGAGFGAIKGRTVELSNVDLAKQFSELIITQRGYQASSQVITTANEMLQQLMDLRGKR